MATWLRRAGQHGRQAHQHVVPQGQVDLPYVQVDELWVKLVGRRGRPRLVRESALFLGQVVRR